MKIGAVTLCIVVVLIGLAATDVVKEVKKQEVVVSQYNFPTPEIGVDDEWYVKTCPYTSVDLATVVKYKAPLVFLRYDELEPIPYDVNEVWFVMKKEDL